MIDIAVLRANPEAVKENMIKKFQHHKLHIVDEVLDVDKECREFVTKGSELRGRKNELSKQIGIFFKNKEIDIIIGTHALFSSDVIYNNLGIPNNKILVGIPFYTTVQTECEGVGTKTGNGKSIWYDKLFTTYALSDTMKEYFDEGNKLQTEIMEQLKKVKYE